MKECAICGEKLDDQALKCSKGHSLFRPPRERDTRRPTSKVRDWLSSCVGQAVFLLVVLLFGFGAVVIWYGTPVTTLTCRWEEANLADCQLQDRMLGVIPIRKVSISLLRGAYVRQETTISEHEDGREEPVPDYSVMLVSISEEESEFSYYGSQRGAAERATGRINNYLSAPTDKELTVRHVPWLAMLGGVAFLSAFAYLFYTWVNMVASQTIKEQLARLRRKLSKQSEGE